MGAAAQEEIKQRTSEKKKFGLLLGNHLGLSDDRRCATGCRLSSPLFPGQRRAGEAPYATTRRLSARPRDAVPPDPLQRPVASLPRPELRSCCQGPGRLCTAAIWAADMVNGREFTVIIEEKITRRLNGYELEIPQNGLQRIKKKATTAEEGPFGSLTRKQTSPISA